MAKKTDIRLRRSNVANAIPGAANLSDGELAMNTMDGALYFKKSNGTIITAHDNNIMHIDSTNDRIGIGETSPAFKLSVNSGTTDWPAFFKSTDNKAGIIIADDDTTAYFGAENSKAFMGLQAGIHANNLNIDSSGNVGIGTLSPSEKLHVKDTVFIDYPDGSGASLKIGRSDSSNYWEVNHAGADFRLYNTASSGSDILFAVDPSGTHQANKVGIGNATPDKKLTVDGDIKIRNGDAFMSENVAGSTRSLISLGTDNILRIKGNDNEGSSNVISMIAGGKVGIGLTSPDSRLHVEQAGVEISTTNLDNGTAVGLHVTMPDAEITSGTTPGVAIGLGMNGRARSYLVNTHTGTNKDAADLSIYTESGGTISEALRVKHDGKVGIGTDTPARALEVDFTGSTYGARFTRSDAAGNSLIEFANNQGVKNVTGFDSGNSGYVISTGSTVHLVVKNSTGHVGIGTTSPGSILHISNASSPEIRLEDSDATSTFNITTFQNAAGTLNFNTRQDDGTFVSTDYQILKNASGANIHKWFIGNSEKLRLDASGRLGIQNSSPGSQYFNTLVVGNTNGDNGITIQSSATGRGVLAFSDTDSATSGRYDGFINYNHTSQYMSFHTNTGNEHMRIDNVGNLLVGTTSASLSSSSSSTGINLKPDGASAFVRDGGTVLYINRLSSDGAIVDFRKGGSSVGAIGTVDGDLNIFPSAGGHKGLRFGNGYIAPTSNGTAVENGTTDLGLSTQKFKDIHLSGTAYANVVKVSSYETELASGHLRFKFNGGAYIDNNTTGQSINFRVSNSSSLDTTVMTMDSDGDVGIGTTNPEAPLDIVKSSSSIQNMMKLQNIDTTVGAGTNVLFQGRDNIGNAVNYGQIVVKHTDTTTEKSELQFWHMKNASPNQAITVNEDGNVGIGNTNPGVPLDVSSNSSAQGIRVKGRSTDDIGQIDLANNGGTVRSQLQWNNSFLNIKAISAIPMIFYTNNAERMRIQSAGEVGIGVASPSELLHVKGTNASIAIDGNGSSNTASIKFINDNERSRITSAYDTGGGGRLTFHTDTTGGSLIERMRIDNAGKITFNGAFTFPNSIGSAGQVLKVPTSGTELIWGNASGGGSGSTLEDNDGDTKIQVEESADEDIIRFDIAGTQKMLLDSTELNLTGDLAVSGNLLIAGDINSTSVTNLDVTDKTITVANNAGSAANANGAGIVVDTGTNNPQMIYTSGTDEWDFNRSIDINGGSGTGLKIHQGGAIVGAKSGGDTQLMYWGGGPVYYGRSNLGGSVSGHEFRVSGVTKLNVNSSGNTIASGDVGIGDNGPSSKLTVKSGASGNVASFSSGTSTSGDYQGITLHAYQSSGVEWYGSEIRNILTASNPSYLNPRLGFFTQDHDTYLPADRTEKMSILDNGRVGIGTTSPAAALHISESSNQTTPQLRITNDTPESLTLGVVRSAAGTAPDTSFISFDNALRFIGGTGTTNERVRITEAGDVCIGNTTASAKLDIRQDSGYAIRAESGSGHYFRVNSTGAVEITHNATTDALLLTTTEDSSSAGPVITLKRNSSTIADADYLGQLKFKGENDADEEVVYAKITSKILDASDGTEDGLIEFANRKAGSNVITARLRSDSLQLLNDTSLALKSDGAQLQFGNDNDMQMYHNGSAGEINNGTGDFTIDSVGDIILDAGGANINFNDDGTAVGHIEMAGSNLEIKSKVADKDIIFKGNDGGSAVTALTLDMSEAGRATFNSDVIVGGNLTSSGNLTFSPSGDYYAGLGSTNALHFENSSGQTLMSTASVNIRIDANDSDTNRFFSVSANSSSNATSSGTNLFRVQEDGKVGVGTSSPEGKFHISGNSDLGDADCMLIIDDVDGSAGSRIPAIMFRSNTGGSVTNQGRIRGSDTQGMILSGSSSLGNDLVVQAGKVGIGTNSPKNQLHVSGGGYFTGFTNPNGSGVGGLEVGYDGTQSVLQSYHRGTGSYKGININASHISFRTSGTERARVDGSNFDIESGGFRVNDPGNNYPFAVTQYGYMTTRSSSITQLNGTDHANVPLSVLADVASTRTASYVEIGNIGSAGNKFKIDSAGNVGVGVTSIPSWANFMTNGTVAVGGVLYIKQDQKIQGLTAFPGAAGYLRINPDGGNVGIGMGSSIPKAKLQIEEYGIDTSETTTTATTQVAIHSFPIADFRTARFTIQITNTTDSTYHSTELIAVHDGTTANITEFGEVHTGSSVEATFDADISSNNFRLLATPASTDSMTFKVVCHSITV